MPDGQEERTTARLRSGNQPHLPPPPFLPLLPSMDTRHIAPPRAHLKAVALDNLLHDRAKSDAVVAERVVKDGLSTQQVRGHPPQRVLVLLGQAHNLNASRVRHNLKRGTQ